MKKKTIKYLLISLLGLILLFSAFYTTWNVINPANTCAQCHEIKPSHDKWLTSPHSDIACIDCHGTALSNGLHSLKEKTGMVISHLTKDKRNEEIRLNERQVLEVSERCITCHRSEHTGWLKGGHGTTYKDIFLDQEHNKMEKPYADCFRCHGMFYDGTLSDLMELKGTPEEYRIKDKKQEEVSAIPCLACHQMHTEADNGPKTSLYIRSEKNYLRTDYLSKIDMYEKGRNVLTPDDPNSRLCIQCHSPNAWHEAGSEDDRTTTGVHEGLSCMACHQPHTNDTRNSCDDCHPALSNCGIDVKAMNTTYLSLESKNNIHHISCVSCHDDYSVKK